MALTPSEWRERIKEGIEYRERYGRSKDWPRFLSYYRGDFGDKTRLPVNMIFAIGRSIIPRIYFRNPHVVVTPLQAGKMLHARVVERLDNLILREIKVKKAMKQACLDAFLYGTGIIKQGFDSQYGFSPSETVEIEGVNMTSTGETEKSRRVERIEYNFNVRPGWPWVQRVHPANFVVPWGTADLDDAPWCAHRIIRPLEDVKADPKYTNTEDLQPTLVKMPTPDDTRGDIYSTHSSTAKYVELWEIYDAKTGKVYVIAEGHDKFLREDDDVLTRFGFPFHVLVFNPDNDHFWGVSDCHQIEPLQLELNEVRTQAHEHRRAALLKFLYRRDAIDDEELMKLLNGDKVGLGVAVDGPVDGSVLPLQPHIPPDFIMESNQIRQDIREVSGFSRNQIGEYDTSSRRTATEAAIVAEAAGIRVDERRDEAADVLANIVRNINAMIFEYWTEPQVAQIVGPDGQRYWTQFTGEALRGDYSYRIDPDSGLPVSAQMRRQEALQLYQALANNPMVRQDVLLQHLLVQFEGIDPDALLAIPNVAGPAVNGVVPIDELALAMARMVSGGMMPNANV